MVNKALGLLQRLPKSRRRCIQLSHHPCWCMLMSWWWQVRYFYRGHDHAFTLNEQPAQTKGVRNGKDVPDVLRVQCNRLFLIWGWKTFTSSFVRTGLFSIDPSLSMRELTIEFSLHWRNLWRHYPGIQYPFVHRWKLKLMVRTKSQRPLWALCWTFTFD